MIIYAVKADGGDAHKFKAGERVIVIHNDGSDIPLLCQSLDDPYKHTQFMYKSQLVDTGDTL